MLDPFSIRCYFDGLIKPPGSLGVWEELAERLCWIQQTLHPVAAPAELVVFAADHGVVQSGVSLWPSSITSLMIEQIATGNAASSVLAAEFGIGYHVVDVGSLNAPKVVHPKLSSRRVAAGTQNLLNEPAMTLHEFREAMSIGADEARMSYLRGAKVVIVGEMGIGNTTSASCLARLLADVPLEQAVGAGAGSSDDSFQAKQVAVQVATDRVFERCGRSIDEAALASVSGFEIVAMAGFYIQAAKQRQVILLDGMIATAAALIAQQYYPEVIHSMIAAHESQEPAHAGMLEKLTLTPMLRWGMRLGEGTGALALYPLLKGASAWVSKMGKIKDLK
jgi:nicotinate-nucleotide--dimethylbenzimidazole phosphoribosyltransferase